MKSGAQFYTTAARKDEFKTPTDFCGKTVGMSRRTSFRMRPRSGVLQTARRRSAGCQSCWYGRFRRCPRPVEASRVDGAVQGSETLPYLMTLEKNSYVIVGEPITAVYQGIAFSKKDPALRDAYAAALKALMASGEYKALFAKHGLEGTMLDGIYINGEAAK